MSTQDTTFDSEHAGQLATRDRSETRRPRRFRVLLHNDDYTTMEFVVYVLVKHFRKSSFEANRIMLDVHEKGMGVAGVYPYDVAETKVARVVHEARENEMPLLCTLEAE